MSLGKSLFLSGAQLFMCACAEAGWDRQWGGSRGQGRAGGRREENELNDLHSSFQYEYVRILGYFYFRSQQTSSGKGQIF